MASNLVPAGGGTGGGDTLEGGSGGDGSTARDVADSGVFDSGGPQTPGAGAGGTGSNVPPELLLDAAAPSGWDAAADAAPDAGSGLDRDAGLLPPLDPELASRYRDLSARLAVLGARTHAFWMEHGPDATFGGFHGTLNRQGNPIAPEDKGLIQETRHLWMLSTWYERREASAAIAALAASTYAFIRDSFVDEADGAFVFKVSRDGRRVVDGKKQMFAETYALYALSTYGRVFDVAEARELALARFLSIDALRHDAIFGGYDQRGDPGVGSAAAEKDANTHLHLLESFTALYEATSDPRVAARLSELCDLIAERLLQPAGYVHAEFRLDWTPIGTAQVSYGHDLETAWLLMDAARVLGRENETGLRAAALRMAEHAASRGFDTRDGGFFEVGVPGGATTDFDKVWWVQFEALLGLWRAYEIGGEVSQLDRLTETLSWIEGSEDLPAGEWFAVTRADGTPLGADYKGDEWKASYHSVRSLVFAGDWLTEALGGRMRADVSAR